MAKTKTSFVCQNCGTNYPKWTGGCENCGEWNTLVEEVPVSSGKSIVAKSASSGHVLSPQTMQSISIEETAKRMSTGYADLDAYPPLGVAVGAGVGIFGSVGVDDAADAGVRFAGCG